MQKVSMPPWFPSTPTSRRLAVKVWEEYWEKYTVNVGRIVIGTAIKKSGFYKATFSTAPFYRATFFKATIYQD
ncbi:hypothetical protein [Pseudomaricurvus sp.]|uniref:hypothetical protein n=1 Tax=Pseudomaricurvus sp. TaxID=2004510 RepID=UPI003F6B029E